MRKRNYGECYIDEGFSVKIVKRQHRWKPEQPKVYQSDGRECYLDPIREKMVPKTREETVRQKVVSKLQRQQQVPKDMLDVEASLKHYGIDSLLRPDIIINRRIAKDTVEPIAVIECKAEEIPLSDSVIQQAKTYCDLLCCTYFAVTNSRETLAFAYDSGSDQYVPIDKLPHYIDMLAGKMIPEEPFQLERLPPRQLWEQYRSEYVGCGRIGRDTPRTLSMIALNLQDCLMDETHRFPSQSWGRYAVLEDLGVRQLNIGNGSGGLFFGPYRTLRVQFEQEMKLVSFGFSSYCTSSRPDLDRTALCVALDRRDGPHHALQLLLDDNVESRESSYLFFHSGRIAAGRKGSGSIQGLRDWVSERDAGLVLGRRFYLGRLVNAQEKILYMDDPEIVELLKNFISYSIIRDEYRANLLRDP